MGRVYLLLMLLFCGTTFAEVYCIKTPSKRLSSYKYSNALFTEHSYAENAKILKVVPTKNDTVIFRTYSEVNIDCNLELASVLMIDVVKFCAENKNIKIYKNFNMQIFWEYVNNPMTLYLKNSTMEVCENFITNVNKSKDITLRGFAFIYLVNSNLNVGKDFTFDAQSVKTYPECRCGLDFYMDGNTSVKIGGDFIIDKFVRDKEFYEMNFTFRERDGFIPKIKLESRKVAFENMKIKVRLTSKAKAGIYPLFELANKDAKINEDGISSIEINVNSVQLGQEFSVYGKKAKVFIGDYAKNENKQKIENDLLLEIK